MKPFAAPQVLLALFIVATASHAQPGVQQQSVDFSGMASVTRTVDKTYPVIGAASVFVSNQFGTVRVVPWGERVVRVQGQIRVGAETPAEAERYAQQIDVDGAHIGDRIEVRTRYPNVAIGKSTDLEISVPSDASVEIVNEFGDVYVEGLAGGATLNVRFGQIGLKNIQGMVRVQAQGRFKLTAQNVTGGGVFVLRSTEAIFNGVQGDVHIDNYLGSVDMNPGDAPVNLAVNCESGPIRLHLGTGDLPDLVATADSGDVISDIALARETWGASTTVRHPNSGAKQQIDLFAWFADIHLVQKALAPAAEPLVAATGAPITDTLERDYDILPGSALRLNLMPGTVRIEGHEGARVEVSAARFVRVANVASARLALEGLAMRADFGQDYLGLTTTVQDDMAALGCTEYRMDVTVRLPRGVPVELRAKDGETEITNLVAALAIDQESGAIRIENVQGNIKISLAKGAIETSNTAGPIDLTARAGDVTVRQPFGDVRVQSEGGNAVIDTPGAGVYARTKGGDVRLIAVNGVKADYDIETEKGNISLAAPDTTDATFWIEIIDGNYRSSVPLTGTSHGSDHTFQGKLNAGTRRIMLKAREGNVVID